jgi:hypothetical protein
MSHLIDSENKVADEDKLVPQSTTKTFTSTSEDLLLQTQKIEDIGDEKMNLPAAIVAAVTTEKMTTTSQEESLMPLG